MQKRNNRANVIKHLMAIDDPLVCIFKERELHPIMNNNAYHSPEVSESDEEYPLNQRKIIVKDLRWRSSTVRFIIMICIYYDF